MYLVSTFASSNGFIDDSLTAYGVTYYEYMYPNTIAYLV